MRKNIFIVLILIVLLSISCHTSNYNPIVEGIIKSMDTDTGGVVYRDLKYKCPTFYRRLLDIYMPPSFDEKTTPKDKKYPLLIHIHGGSWIMGDKKLFRYSDALNMEMWKNDVAIATISYRFAKQTLSLEAIEKDIYYAMEFLKNNSTKYHLDINNIILWGQSAGANLVLLYGLKNPEGISCIVDEYGPTDILALSDYKGPDGDDDSYGMMKIMSKRQRKAVSPYYFVNKNSPPIVIFHGTADEVVPISQSEKLVKKAKENNVTVEINYIEGGNHVFTNKASKKVEKQRMKKMIETILKYFKIKK